MLKKYFIVVALVLGGLNIYAQDGRQPKLRPEKPKVNWKEQIYWGGNLGLQLTNSGSLIDLSPNAGYKFNKYVSVGPQIIYTNISYKSSASGLNYHYTFYGGGAFVRLQTFNWLFLQAEYDLLSVPNSFSVIEKKRALADVALAGLGFKNQIGEKSCYYATIMYEFAPTPNSPYTYGPFNSPLVYRFGFNVNF
ncbi:MAG: hypothetical protein ACJ76F_13190 [Bacteroidia bacterium]